MQTVEEFLAKGGKITQVEEGERTLTPRELRDRVRGEDKPVEQDYTALRMRSAENQEEVRHAYYG